MAKYGKKFKAALEKLDRLKKYELTDGLNLVRENAYAQFNESVDVAVRLGVDPRKADQNIRGSVVLPKGSGKKFRILVFAKGEKEKEAWAVSGSTTWLKKRKKKGTFAAGASKSVDRGY